MLRKDSHQLVHLQSVQPLLSAWKSFRSLATHNAPSENWSDVDEQNDLSVLGAHNFVSFALLPRSITYSCGLTPEYWSDICIYSICSAYLVKIWHTYNQKQQNGTDSIWIKVNLFIFVAIFTKHWRLTNFCNKLFSLKLLFLSVTMESLNFCSHFFSSLQKMTYSKVTLYDVLSDNNISQ